MKVTFLVRFTTRPGQNLFLGGDIPELGLGRIDRLIPMQYLDQEFWNLTIHLPEVKKEFRYRYYLDNGQGVIPEGEHHRTFMSIKGRQNFTQIDTWMDAGLVEHVFFTAPFEQKIVEQRTKPKENGHVCFKVKWPLPLTGQRLALVGAVHELGRWDVLKAIPMSLENGWWQAQVDLAYEGMPIAYKYGAIDVQGNWMTFEEGANRVLRALKKDDVQITIHDGFVKLPTPTWKGAGVAIPVFSLRSNNSWGVGEFDDIKLMAKWAAKTGLKMIQVLPINDTTATKTWTDSYPYAAVSAFAMHPLYLNPRLMAGAHQGILEEYENRRGALNDLEAVDYEGVIELKETVFKRLYALDKQQFLKEARFKSFFEHNRSWLEPYALFSWFRDKFNTIKFHEWPEGAVFSLGLLEKYVRPKSKSFKEISYYFFLQYHLHLQLHDAVQDAHRHGVFIKGDIPIGIYRYSCDAWVAPEQYFMDQQAGAPPDDFAIKGQNWGFPTYNWPAMQEDNFQWWRNRFSQMSHYFDAFRIDHILGFFRIWSIPMHAVEGLLGRFVPALALRPDDFKLRGINWNRDRFCVPYINDAVLTELFGKDAEYIIQEFLHPSDPGLWRLRPEYDQQIKIQHYFDTKPPSDQDALRKQGLFDLIANVILLEDGSGNDQYHFRINMTSTSSFQYLEDTTKHRLRDLYTDYFYHRQDTFWQEEALRKLPHLKQSTDMLICGEDLGMVPHGVPQVMKSLGILSLEIQRMPKDPMQEFFIPSTAPYLSVITPSTHDMSTIRGWWLEDRDTTQRFYQQVLGQWGEAPNACPAWVNKLIIQQHLEAPAMWSIFQWQELLGMDEELRRADVAAERINIPAVVHHYWKYRMHHSLENMLNQHHFNGLLEHMIRSSGR